MEPTNNETQENMQLAREMGYSDEDAKEALKNNFLPAVVIPDPDASGEGEKVFLTIDTGKILSAKVRARDPKTNQPIPNQYVEAKHLVVVEGGVKKTLWLSASTLKKALLGVMSQYRQYAGLNIAIYKAMVNSKFGKSKVYRVVPVAKSEVEKALDDAIVDKK